MLQRRQSAVLIGTTLAVVLLLLLTFFLLPGTNTPHIRLADPVPGPGEGDGLSEGYAIGIEITPDNVQAVIATLSRLEYYSREIRQTHYWDEGLSSAHRTAEIWVAPEALRIRWDNSENMLITAEAFHLWFGTGRVISRPLTEGLGDSHGQILDQFQGIPSYEAVLELNPTQIRSAGYTTRTIDDEARYTIYVSTESPMLGYISYYYICLQTGLLIEVVTLDGEVPVFRMETLRLYQGPLSPDRFALPSA
ncbi:MAG: hypothetical protein FWE12_01115 [Oscillospiraceae bacterium]|nr:hypothetical protein [Oscillospiraceae bacterium]